MYILPGTSWFLVLPLLSNIYAIIQTRNVIVHSRITHSSKIRQCVLQSYGTIVHMHGSRTFFQGAGGPRDI